MILSKLVTNSANSYIFLWDRVGVSHQNCTTPYNTTDRSTEENFQHTTMCLNDYSLRLICQPLSH